MDEAPAVYILTTRKNTVLYTGVTRWLAKRVFDHAAKTSLPSFTARYNVNKLVYFELAPSMEQAILREKQIKGWVRRRKVALIGSRNPRSRNRSTVILSIPSKPIPGRIAFLSPVISLHSSNLM